MQLKKMFSEKRGQTATEYMIILAIVIVIALIVAAILGVLPGIGGETRGRGSEAYWNSAEIGVVSYSIANDGVADDAYLLLRNNEKDTITITDVRFDDEIVSTTDHLLQPGDTVEVTSTDVGDICKAGGKFSVYLNITYTKEPSGDTFEFSGNNNKLEGDCAE